MRPGEKRHLGIIHFRLGKRDGVSLEIDKRIKLLKKYPLKITLIGGNIHPQFKRQSCYLPWLDLDRTATQKVFNAFLRGSRLSQKAAANWYQELESDYYQRWKELFAQKKFDFLIIHNLLSLPLILPATIALIKALSEKPIPVLAVNHDFWFNRDYFLASPYRFVKKQLEQLPPKKEFIRHQVINSLDQKELWRRKRIRAEKIGDYWDYDQSRPRIDRFNRQLPTHFGIKQNDLFLLQATRIVPRKAIENTLLFAVELERLIRKRAPLKLNGKILDQRSRVVVFFSNFPDLDFHWYRDKLVQLAQRLGIKTIWAHQEIALKRRKQGSRKIFSFWDPYLFADLIAYPSIKEGFGNQFLEAVFFKKPIVLFEYPVFKADIKPEGYRYISLGDKTYRRDGFNFVTQAKIRTAAQEALDLLCQPKLCRQWAETNFQIARRHHSLKQLEQNLKKNVLHRLKIRN